MHDPYRCPAHVGDCGCPDRSGWLCNPYYVAGHCPDDGGEDGPEAA